MPIVFSYCVCGWGFCDQWKSGCPLNTSLALFGITIFELPIAEPVVRVLFVCLFPIFDVCYCPAEHGAGSVVITLFWRPV